MPSYITVHEAGFPEQLRTLVARAESFIRRPTGNGIRMRNLAVVPRICHLYLLTDATASGLIHSFLDAEGLRPISVAEAGDGDWGRLLATLHSSAHSSARWHERPANHGATHRGASRHGAAYLGLVPATGFEPVISTLKG